MTEINKEINRIINKAENYLKVAKDLLESGNYEHAVSRAYYCVFHGMVAVLFSEKMKFSSHSAVIAKFREHFIKQVFSQKNILISLVNYLKTGRIVTMIIIPRLMKNKQKKMLIEPGRFCVDL